MNAVSSRKADIGLGVSFIANLVMFILVISTGGYILSNVGLADVKAENLARNFGATIDVTMVTPGGAVVVNECPGDIIFTFEGKTIHVLTHGTIGDGQGSYSFMAPYDLKLARTSVDCSLFDFVKVTKQVGNDAKTTLTVGGLNENE